MRILVHWVLLGFTLPVLNGCSGNKDREGFEFIGFEKINYKVDTVAPGTPVRLIAYSGGIDETEKEIYYHQFIGVDKTTNDTLRILTSFITFPAPGSEKNKSARNVYLYSRTKRLTDAEIYPHDSIMVLLQNLSEKGYSESEVKDIPTDIEPLTKEIKRKRFVVLNKDMDIFQRNFKTVIGVLQFKEQPWD